MRQQVHRVHRRVRIRSVGWCLLVALLCSACNLGGTLPTRPGTKPPTVSGISGTPGATSTPNTTGSLNEGVHATGADAWHAAGFTGKGVKVGLIDTGFINYAQVLAGAKVTPKSFRDDGQVADATATEDTVHGTACAEIVHEMAPDAELFLAATDGTPGSFIAATQWLVGTIHAPIITSSLGFYGDYPTDGSSALAKAVDKAKTAGVLFVKSAGNFGDKHYGATFTDTDGDGFHDFPGGKTKNALTLRLTGDPLDVFLNWDDWARPHVNYDLLLYNSAGQEAGRSDIDQTKTGKNPVEHIQGVLRAGTYTLQVKKVNPRDPNLPINLIIRGAQAELTTPGGSITVPGDAHGAVAVAAINVKTDVVEPFSSHGPTLDGRVKPELGAPDRVMSRAYASVNVPTFPGTSAAAPHVGGAAALYKQANPDATADAIIAFLTQHAAAPQGKDRGQNITGSGLLNLGAAPAGGARPPAPVVAATPAATAARPGPIFTDDFSSPRTGLPAQGYVNKTYRVTADASGLNVLAYPNAPTSDAVYEVQARKTGGAEDAMMGLVVRRTDTRDALYFVITNDGLFNVEAKVGGSLRSLSGGFQQSTAIVRGGMNTLRVTATGTTFAFSVNGKEVTRLTVPDASASGGFGFVAGGGQRSGAEVTFTNYSVTAP